jgi:hypothetical protein
VLVGQAGVQDPRAVAGDVLLVEATMMPGSGERLSVRSTVTQLMPPQCTYDGNPLNTTIAFDILHTHPVAIIGGLLHEDPFVVWTEALLRDVLGRAAPRPCGG